MRDDRKRRGISVGTVVMLALTAVVIAGMLVVLGTLSGKNARLDLSRIPEGLSLSSEWILNGSDTKATAKPAPGQSGQTAVKPAQTEMPGGGMLQVVTEPPASVAEASLTFGGTIAVTATIRRSCYYAGSKKYDFDELLDLTGGSLNSDLTVVTLENLVDEEQSNSDLVTPADVLKGLKDNGVDAVNLGFVKCLDKGVKTLSATVQAARSAGLATVGAYGTEQEASADGRIRTIGGIRIAVLAYTDNLTSAVQKKLTSSGTPWLVPVTAAAETDIAAVKAAGA